MNVANSQSAIERYFKSMEAALSGLELFLSDNSSPLYNHELVGRTIEPYLQKLATTFSCWENRIGFIDKFRIDQADSGFPVYQNLLQLSSDYKEADKRLEGLASSDELKAKMADHIFSRKGFPVELQEDLAERTYLEHIKKGEVFAPFMLPETIKVSVNPRNGRPFYVCHWGAYDGSQTLPMVYMATIEDSSKQIGKLLIGKDGKLKPNLI